MNIQQSTVGKYLFKLVLQQLVHTGAAGNDHSLDVQIIERIGNSVKQDTVFRGYRLALISQAR